MEKVLLLHSSSDGQTVKILKYIEKNLGEGCACELVDLNTITSVNFADYSRVLIGASIRYGHLNKKLYKFIENNLLALKQAKVGFFCVNLTARKEGKNTPETSVYMKTFLRRSPWQPELQAVFAGALRYPRYGWLDRMMIQFIMRITGGETDTSKEVEYTDWQKVEAFADRFKSF
ncbi:menaquinone-dependent protoporphyrinogen IX dehydrogenase [Photobacterium sp. ZSDE20]|uniref:Protoporphyrinogen IX dehydrogenase [quinone] n=1 Tax=Photobacterium pectinilyticum TaxID=2906793 RepID=A0ABT1NB05_9GAMM|nr:menaquinone-dependent protoporphyrinogen IX dehydrogenase [Photobacterium sp. ZSDE20]MCQ1061302.1 menaquinone-dependent protoporphyrinogen IX dehydrogenase [Photobacterium sp. ZSDE20]MDD1829843.1 menaquinone-dependent protoporphyrinogen IX dehydrogenase [Photobacterium sp. ZSDE20]